MTTIENIDSRRKRIEELWDRHCELEFSLKDADRTVETMIDEPYVNHIPTMTGGSGKTNWLYQRWTRIPVSRRKKLQPAKKE